jgi:hypothetical protein
VVPRDESYGLAGHIPANAIVHDMRRQTSPIEGIAVAERPWMAA